MDYDVKVQKLNKHLIEARVIGRKAKMLMASDVHFDSKYCDRKLLKEHLEEAKEIGAMVFFNGDLFDVMGCDRDPRSKAADIRKEYIQSDRSYLDLVIEDVYEFLKPYKQNIIAMGYGNHETAIMKYRDTDPIQRLCMMLNSHKDSNIEIGGYKGCLRITNQRSKNEHSSGITNIAYHHGYGGGARRSKGILNADIELGMYPFADVIFSGHTHDKLLLPMNTYDLNKVGELIKKKKYWLKGGSYKDTSDKAFGFEVQKGFGLTVSGGWWLGVHYKGENRFRHIKVTEAQ